MAPIVQGRQASCRATFASRRLSRAERTALRQNFKRQTKQVAYLTLADAEAFLCNLRTLGVVTRQSRDARLFDRFDVAGHYLILKRYCAEMRRIVAMRSARA